MTNTNITSGVESLSYFYLEVFASLQYAFQNSSYPRLSLFKEAQGHSLLVPVLTLSSISKSHYVFVGKNNFHQDLRCKQGFPLYRPKCVSVTPLPILLE